MWQLKQAGCVLMGKRMERKREKDASHGACEALGYVASGIRVEAFATSFI